MTSATKTDKRDAYDLSDYEKWLRRGGYQPSTMVVTLRNLRTIAAEGKKPAETLEPHIRRYLRFVEETKKQPLGRDFTAKMKKAGIAPSAAIEKHGKRPSKLLDMKSMSALRSKLRRGEETDLLIAAYMNSGMRITAFIALRADKVTDEHTDAVSRKWIKKNGGSKPLYRLLCETEIGRAHV